MTLLITGQDLISHRTIPVVHLKLLNLSVLLLTGMHHSRKRLVSLKLHWMMCKESITILSTVDVSNLQNGLYNDYDIHDKVYIKVPGTSELITAKVVETTKEANDIASNKIKLSNYTINTLKTVTLKTLINCSNLNFKYPAKKQLTARLENLDYNN